MRSGNMKRFLKALIRSKCLLFFIYFKFTFKCQKSNHGLENTHESMMETFLNQGPSSNCWQLSSRGAYKTDAANTASVANGISHAHKCCLKKCVLGTNTMMKLENSGLRAKRYTMNKFDDMIVNAFIPLPTANCIHPQYISPYNWLSNGSQLLFRIYSASCSNENMAMPTSTKSFGRQKEKLRRSSYSITTSRLSTVKELWRISNFESPHHRHPVGEW